MNPAGKKVPFWSVMVAVGVGNFLAALSSTTVIIMLPVFMKEFSADIVTVQWMVTGYMLSSGMVAPLIAYVADRFSLRRTYIFAVAGFIIASLLVGLATSVSSLIGFRVLQGCFGGMVFPVTMSLIYQVVEREKQAFALSIWSVSGVLAPTFGPTVAGILTDLVGWQWVFFFNVPISLLVILVAWKFVPYYTTQEDHQGQAFDWFGLSTAIIGTYCLLFVFSNFSVWGLFSLKTSIFFILGVGGTILFVRRELTYGNPLLNLNVLRDGNFAWSMVVLCVASITMEASIVVLPIYLQDILGYSTTVSALLLALGPLLIFFVVPMIGKVYDRIDAKKLLYVMMIIGGLAMVMHMQLDLLSAGLFVALAVVVRDLGVGAISMPATNMGMQGIQPLQTNHASATSSWVRQCVTSLAIGLINTFLALRAASYTASANSQMADGLLQYHTSYVMAMRDLYLGIIFVTIFGLFAISRMHQRKHAA